MVTDPGNYRWSSYAAHDIGNNVGMWTPHPVYLSLGENNRTRKEKYREMISESLDINVIAKIRHCANKGLILGTEKFRKQFEHLTGDSA